MRFLAISGSLRASSSNAALLRAAARLAPPGVEVDVYEGVATLPHFNPDVEEGPAPLPAAVLDLRGRVGAADGLLISCPEYARGVPGAFKNALDWLVGSAEFPGKPVALLNASPRATDAQAALALILTTMSARLVADAAVTVPVSGRGLDAVDIAADPALAGPLRAALAAFAQAVEAP